MRQTFKITWEAEDGYCGPSRPHSFRVDADSVDAETEEEARELFWQLVDDEFRAAVSPISEDEDAFVSWVLANNQEDQGPEE